MNWSDWLAASEARAPQEATSAHQEKWKKLNFPEAGKLGERSVDYSSNEKSLSISDADSSASVAAKVEVGPIQNSNPATASERGGSAVESKSEPRVYSVGQLNKLAKSMLERELHTIWLRGEISNFRPNAGSGHWYFSLKDSQAQISAVMFRGFAQQVNFKPADGMEVLIRGKVTLYEGRGQYQIVADSMETVGAGALQQQFEKLKAQLQAEGLFSPERKRSIPSFPKRIALVTSPTGAAVRDMLNVLARRYRGGEILVIPCAVQGDKAPGEIVAALASLNRLREIDVAIVGRGGGSIEDLWAFNDERVARAIVASRVPIISAVGHEIDFTIADFVADLRAPTPSAAAELVSQSAGELSQRIARLRQALRLAVWRRLNEAKIHCTHVVRRLIDPRRTLQEAIWRCDELRDRLERSMRLMVEARRSRTQVLRAELGDPTKLIAERRWLWRALRARLQSSEAALRAKKFERVRLAMSILDSLSPLRVLDRGYAVVRSSQGVALRDSQQVRVGDEINVRLSVGQLTAQVKATAHDST
ncbi:MAG TPA: exodeoxyribonuclease VII large subunit [Pseudobdellovibrionaceae bacterium]|nr:exodeoxyribonuclease VII large subunit [Pseudobdellovibrionaceae bacterium]